MNKISLLPDQRRISYDVVNVNTISCLCLFILLATSLFPGNVVSFRLLSIPLFIRFSYVLFLQQLYISDSRCMHEPQDPYSISMAGRFASMTQRLRHPVPIIGVFHHS
jgi:hypothetical protein